MIDSTVGDIVEPQVFPRYTINVTRGATASQGRNYEVQVETRANFTSGPTRVRLIVPELQSRSARRKREVEALDSWVVSLDSGATDVRSVRIALPMVGKYALIADAAPAAAEGVAPTRRRQTVQDVVSELFEFEAADTRLGKLEKRSRPISTGDAVRDCPVRSNALCGSRAPRSTTAGEQSGIAGGQASLCAEGDAECCEEFPEQCGGNPPPAPVIHWVSAYVNYMPIGGQQYKPMRQVIVSVTGAGIASMSARTDDNGYVDIPCAPAYHGIVYLQVNLTNSTDLFITQTYPSQAISINMGDQCTSPNIFTSGWREAEVWENVLRAVKGTRTRFGFSRPPVQVRVTAAYATSLYRASDDFIAIHPDHVPDEPGVFTASYEFGHSVHQKLPQGIPNFSCPSPHPLD